LLNCLKAPPFGSLIGTACESGLLAIGIPVKSEESGIVHVARIALPAVQACRHPFFKVLSFVAPQALLRPRINLRKLDLRKYKLHAFVKKFSLLLF